MPCATRAAAIEAITTAAPASRMRPSSLVATVVSPSPPEHRPLVASLPDPRSATADQQQRPPQRALRRRGGRG